MQHCWDKNSPASNTVGTYMSQYEKRPKNTLLASQKKQNSCLLVLNRN